MADIEQLAIVIDVIDEFSDELNELLVKLAEVETAARAVDDINIDVDVRGQGQLNALIGQLAAAQAMGGGVGIGVGGAGGGGGGGGGAARTATSTVSKAADEAAEGLFNMNLRMTDVHNALARLVPLILAIIGAVPALLGAFFALAGAAVAAAAALAALTAFGALGAAMARGGGNITEGFMEMLNEVQDDFMDAFSGLASRLRPLFEDALTGLGRLFQRIADQGDALVDLTDDARAFGGWVMSALPSFLNELARFVDAMDGAFGVLADFAGRIDIFGLMAGVIAETLGPLMLMLDAFREVLPAIIEVSSGFLFFIGAMLAGIGILAKLASWLPISGRLLGVLAAATLTAATAVFIFNSAILQNLLGSLAMLGTRILALISTYTSYSASSLIAAASTYGLATAILTLIGIATLGIGAVLALGATTAVVGDQFGVMSSKIDSATSSLRRFQRLSSGLGSSMNPYGDPDVSRGEGRGRSRFANGNVSVVVEGNADDETVRNQSHNAMYRMERPRRGK